MAPGQQTTQLSRHPPDIEVSYTTMKISNKDDTGIEKLQHFLEENRDKSN